MANDRQRQMESRRANQQRRTATRRRQEAVRPEAKRLMKERDMSKTDAFALARELPRARATARSDMARGIRRAQSRGTSLLEAVPDQPPRMEYSSITPRVRSVEELANRYQAYKDPETGKMRYEYYNIIDATGEGVWQDIDEATYNQALAEAQRVIDEDYDLR